MPEEDIDALVDVLLGKTHREDQEDKELAALLSGPFQAVRDQNHVEADCVLVWNRTRHPVLESVPFHELTLRYPCDGEGDGWDLEELGKVVRAKGTLYRQSIAAHDLSEEDPTATPFCGTVVLIARAMEEERHRWVIEKSAIRQEELR